MLEPLDINIGYRRIKAIYYHHLGGFKGQCIDVSLVLKCKLHPQTEHNALSFMNLSQPLQMDNRCSIVTASALIFVPANEAEATVTMDLPKFFALWTKEGMTIDPVTVWRTGSTLGAVCLTTAVRPQQAVSGAFLEPLE